MTRKRILHIFRKMDRGGAETWIMNVLRKIDRGEFDFHFAVATDEPGAYDDEIRSLGGQVIPLRSTRNHLAYLRSLRELIREHGPYRAIHSHVQDFSGPILTLARMEGVPVRIAHSHLDTRQIDADATIARKLYLTTARSLVRRYSTHRLGCSIPASVSLFGQSWVTDPQASLHYCGIDLGVFESNAGPSLRGQLGLPEDAFVVGHVARFYEQKNHEFIVRVAREAVTQHKNLYFLLIGDGPLRANIEDAVGRAGVADQVMFLGVRSDIPDLMMRVMDAFILPSHQEGLPIVGIEAQAAGLRCLVSDKVTRELGTVTDLVEFLPIDDPTIWAERLSALKRLDRPVDRGRATAALAQSHFNVEVSVRNLVEIYGHR